jgi:osmotically inducible protein OsmC
MTAAPTFLPLYTTAATAEGGRTGHVTSVDGMIDVDLASPRELGGPGGATNPEQLFAAGYAACFESALRLVAGKLQKDVTGARITAVVTLGKTANSQYGLQVSLQGYLPALSDADAMELMKTAHGVCPYSNATRGNVDVALSVLR